MTPQPDDHVRLLLGAYVLGHLAAGEAAAVRGHLDVCRTCRRDASELAPVADLLPLADPERIGTTDDPAPSREMLDEVLGRIERERNERDRSRRRSILARVTLVAAALAIVTVIAAVVSEPAEPAGGQFVAMVAVQAGVIGEAVVHEDPQSTWVELTTSGLAAGETYAVWLEEVGTGARAPLGTFVGVEGHLYISLYSTLPRDRATSVGVSTPDGDTVMEGTIPAPAAT
ncbi:MAG TPA: zf-HC2 domain-containing protein [Actinomycetota bacterium]